MSRAAFRGLSSRRLSLLLSLGLHLFGAYALAMLLLIRPPARAEPPGSEELDVELVSPHLAPPPRQNGLTRRGTTRAQQQGPGRQGQLAVKLEHLGQRARQSESQRRAELACEQRVQKTALTLDPWQAKQTQQEQKPELKVAARAALAPGALHQHQPQDASRPHPHGELAAAQAPAHELQKLFATVLPESTAPVALARTVRAEHQQRQARQEQALAASRDREATVARRLAQLSAALQADGRRSDGQAELGRARQDGSAGTHGGAPQLGLRFYLSGRQVASSRVVRPPEPLSLPEIRCTIASVNVAPATVRMLVDKAGAVGVAYLRHSSRSAHFDRCAIDHAKAIRFKPGTDKSGLPLNVWIHVRVEPSTVGVAGS